MVEKPNNEEEPTDIFSELYKLGLSIFVDDVHDLPKGPFHTPEEIKNGDFPVHHFLYGLLIMVGATAGKVYYALDSARQLNEAVETVQKP